MGIVSEVSLKVMPRPAHSLTMKLEINSHIDALEHMSLLARSAYPISGNCWIDGIQYVRFEGAYSAVERQRRTMLVCFQMRMNCVTAPRSGVACVITTTVSSGRRDVCGVYQSIRQRSIRS